MNSQQDDVHAFEEKVSFFRSLTYEQLSDLCQPGERARTFRLANRGWLRYGPMGQVDREFRVDGQTVYLTTLVGIYGLINKRVAVEVSLLTESGAIFAGIAPAYFERFRSGKLHEPRAKMWHIILIGLAVLVLAIGGVALFK